MQQKTIIVLALLALGLGGWVYFYEILGQEKRDTEQDVEKRLFEVERDKIKSLTIQNLHGTFELVHEGDGWRLTSPIEASADSNSAEDIIYALNSLRYTKIVDESPSDYTPFGLATPNSRIGFTTDEGEDALLIGEKTPVGSDIYIRRSQDSRVYLTSYRFDSKVNKDMNDWRNKHVLDFSVPDVSAIRIEGKGLETIDFAREGDGWTAVGHEGLRLDATAVTSLLYEFQSLRVKTFTGQKELEPFGLDDPARVVTLTLKSGDEASKIQLLVGEVPEGGAQLPLVYGGGTQGPLENEVAQVDSTLMMSLNKSFSEYRSKQVLELERESIEELDVSLENENLTAKRKADDDDSWLLEGSLQDKSSSSDVDAVLDDVARLHAEEILDDVGEGGLAAYGLSEPEIRMVLKEKEGADAVELHLGEVKDGDTSTVYARVPGQTGIYKVNKYLIEDIRDVLLKTKDESAEGEGANDSSGPDSDE